ncbi:unnamed protein product [Cunninghamella echinulata]
MDSARKQVKALAPAPFVQQLIRQLIISPPKIAQLAINDLTKPLGSQKKWIKRFKNNHWKGVLIGENIKKDSEETALDRLKNADIVIYEIHGGGFRLGHCQMYMDAFIQWITLLKENHGVNAIIMSVEYGLAPKVQYPVPIHQCVSSYNYLTKDLGVSPSKIIVSGDSAGGAIGLEMLCHVYAPQLLHQANGKRTNFDLALPAGILLCSPVTSVNQTSESWKKYEATDLVSHKLFYLVIKEYIGLKTNNLDEIPMLKIFKHLSEHGGMDQICNGNVLFVVGNKEVFSDDILKFVDGVKKNTSKVKVNTIKSDYCHDWYLIREIVRQEDKPMLQLCDKVVAKWFYRTVDQYKNTPSSFSSLTSAEVNEKDGFFLPNPPLDDPIISTPIVLA